MRDGVVASAHRLLEEADRVVARPACIRDGAEVVVAFGVVRLQLDGAAKMRSPRRRPCSPSTESRRARNVDRPQSGSIASDRSNSAMASSIRPSRDNRARDPAQAGIIGMGQQRRFVTGNVLAKHFRREIGVEQRAVAVARRRHLQPQVAHFRRTGLSERDATRRLIRISRIAAGVVVACIPSPGRFLAAGEPAPRSDRRPAIGNPNRQCQSTTRADRRASWA